MGLQLPVCEGTRLLGSTHKAIETLLNRHWIIMFFRYREMVTLPRISGDDVERGLVSRGV